jgi:hypothetical protein
MATVGDGKQEFSLLPNNGTRRSIFGPYCCIKWTKCCLKRPWIILVQQSTMTSDHISAGMTCALWNEESLEEPVFSKECTFPIPFIEGTKR